MNGIALTKRKHSNLLPHKEEARSLSFVLNEPQLCSTLLNLAPSMTIVVL